MPCINLEKIPYLKDYSLHDKEIEYVNSSVGIQDKHPTTKYKFYYVQFSSDKTHYNGRWWHALH